MSIKRMLLAFGLILLALPLLLGGTTALAQDTGQLPAFPSGNFPQTVDQTAVSTTDTTSAVSALGSVEAKSVVELYFETSGTVNGIYATVGDYVQAGEVLADLDASDAWNSYQQAQLSLESAQLSMSDLLEPPTDSELAAAKASVTSAQASYSSVANGSDDQIAQLQLKVDQAQAQLDALQTARQNMNGTEAEIALQDAKIGAQSYNLEIAKLNLEEAQTPDTSSLWSASVRIQQAQLQLEQLQAGATQSEIDSAQLKIDSAQAKVTDAQTALLETQLVAPISGYVTAINLSAGDAANTGSVVMQISDTSALQMTVPVNELDVRDIAAGQTADIELDALSGVDIPGTVENVGWLSSTSSDGIVTYDVVVRLNTDDARVRIGMTGQVTIDTGSAS